MQKHELDEILNPQVKVGLVLVVILSAIFWSFMLLENRFDQDELLPLAITMTAITFVPIAIILVMLKARLRIDESGVTVQIPFRRDLVLPWGQIRTVAHVQLQANRYHTLVLSPLEPQDALKRSRFVLHSGRKDSEIRLVYTEARRLAIEHWLGRKLSNSTL